MSGKSPSPTARVLMRTAEFCYRHPVIILVSSFLLFLVCVGISGKWLVFESDRGALISESDELHDTQQRFLDEFPDSDDVVIMVEGGQASEREHFIDDLAARLKSQPELYRYVFAHLDLPFLREHALYYLDLGDLERLEKSLREAEPFLRALSGADDLSELLSGFGHSSQKSGLGPLLPFLNKVLDQLLVSLQTRGRFEYRSPWGDLFFGGSSLTEVPSELREPGQHVFYHTLANGSIHLLMLRPDKDNPQAVPKLRKLLLEVQKEYPKLRVGLTGELILEYDETVSSEQDSRRSAILSLLLVAALFSFAFRQLVRPLMAIYALIIGVGWTVGFTTLAIGHLNLLTVTFATILIGLGIDFGIHFLFRYEEEFAHCPETLEAMRRTMAGVGVENLMGALSTAVAFWAVGFTGFKGVAEIGIIAGTGVMLCYISMATVLITLVFLQDRHRGANDHSSEPGMMMAIERWVLRRNLWVLGAAVFVSLWCLAQLPYMHFDYNLLRLQDPSLDSVQSELRLIRTGDRTILFAVSLADSVDEALELSRRYEALPEVSRAESLGPLIPRGAAEKSKRIRDIQALLARIKVPGTPEPGLEDGQDLQKMAVGFLELDRAFRRAYPDLVNSGDAEVRANAIEFKELLDRLFSTLENMGPGPIEDGLESFQRHFFGDLANMLNFLKNQRVGPPVTIDEMPTNLKIRSVGTTGKLVVRIYPSHNIWEREAMERFVTEVRKVDRQAVGAPVMMLHHTSALKGAFETSGFYALAAVCVILLLHFRSFKTAFLALLPLGLGILWMLGAMKYYQVWFNPANFMGLPLILGIGLDFGIHVVHRVLEEGKPEMFTHSTGPATTLSALTTVAGFGTMALAHHQGIGSLGFVLTAGVVSIMIAALVVLPAIFRFSERFKRTT
ncbi:MAG: MMPL family transporter [Candidatus Eremiobacteraeota bacterium]|nr:MMPL family transporter [Candidatus Eremiobacteraeota bacterium]